MKKYKLHNDAKPLQTKIDYKKELNKEQFKVISNASGPCLVLAGAGSGKTRTLVYLCGYLLEHGVHPQNIMLVTFTNKAAREMMNRVELLLKYQPKGLWGGTFHHLANRILRQHAKLLDYQNNFAILDDDDSKTLLKSCIAELGIDIKREHFPKVDIISSIISFHQNSLESIENIIERRFSYIKIRLADEIKKIFHRYTEKKIKSNVMDFDDLLHNWWALLKNNKTAAQRLSQQFHFILVDEYQDTNKIQGEIIYMLSQKHQNIVAVGDDSQSIYSFRAATINNILEFPKKFKGSKIFKLETNYRSSPQILDVANSSIQNNRHQYEKKLRSVRESSTKPALAPLNDSEEQAEFIAQRILEMEDQGIPLNEIAVLFRAAHHALELELELNKRNIPYEMRGGIRFFEQAHIKDVVSYLRVLNNPKDEISWKRLLQLYPGIGIAASHALWEKISSAKELPHIVAIANDSETRWGKSFSDVQKIISKLLNIKENFISSCIQMILDTGYKKYLETHFENAADRTDDLEQLANFALSYKNLDEFLSEVTLSEAFKGKTAAGPEENERQSLILSTIHQAKGLEWKSVFVIGLTEGSFPHYKVFEKPDELEEERRLFYVAVTRAKDELYLTYPIISYNFRTGQNINRPSGFLKEIDDELFEKWEVEPDHNLPNIEYLNVDTSLDSF